MGLNGAPFASLRRAANRRVPLRHVRPARLQGGYAAAWLAAGHLPHSDISAAATTIPDAAVTGPRAAVTLVDTAQMCDGVSQLTYGPRSGPLPAPKTGDGPLLPQWSLGAAGGVCPGPRLTARTIHPISERRRHAHGARPPVITHHMLHTVLRRRVLRESVEQIQPALIIPTGKRKGRNPSVASVYRAPAEHAKREAYPEAVEQAHADAYGDSLRKGWGLGITPPSVPPKPP